MDYANGYDKVFISVTVQKNLTGMEEKGKHGLIIATVKKKRKPYVDN